MFTIICPFCHQPTAVNNEQAGAIVRCQQCHQLVTAPMPPVAAAVPAEEPVFKTTPRYRRNNREQSRSTAKIVIGVLLAFFVVSFFACEQYDAKRLAAIRSDVRQRKSALRFLKNSMDDMRRQGMGVNKRLEDLYTEDSKVVWQLVREHNAILDRHPFMAVAPLSSNLEDIGE